MDHNFITEQYQTVNTKKLGVFGNFFSEFKIGSLLNMSGISKTKGAAPVAVFTIVFNLAFTGKNFFQGMVKNKNIRIANDKASVIVKQANGKDVRIILILSEKERGWLALLLTDTALTNRKSSVCTAKVGISRFF